MACRDVLLRQAMYLHIVRIFEPFLPVALFCIFFIRCRLAPLFFVFYRVLPMPILCSILGEAAPERGLSPFRWLFHRFQRLRHIDALQLKV